MNTEFNFYYQITRRAEKLGVVSKTYRIRSLLDIENAHKHFNIDLKKWLESDDENFVHDFIGITNNIDRENPTNFGMFVPRFVKIN